MFLTFHDLREILWKDLQVLCFNFKLVIVTCKLTNFLAWNFLPTKLRLFENMIKLLFICATLSNVCEKSYEKTYLFFSIFSNFHFSFMCSQNFMTGKLQKKLCRLLQYVNQNLFIAQTLNNIFDENYEKPYNVWNLFLKFVSSVRLSRSFIMISYL